MVWDEVGEEERERERQRDREEVEGRDIQLEEFYFRWLRREASFFFNAKLV